MGRILALDYGAKRIGVALSDENKKIAFPKPFIEAEKRGELLKLITDEAVEKILIGLPISLAGKETKSTKAAKDFAKWLKENSRAEIELIDERFTTKEIQSEMKNLEVKSKKYRKEIDSLVAQKMLERYLKTKKPKNGKTKSF